MEHLAIDLGGKESQICVRSSEGQIVEERRCRTATLPTYLATRPRSRVVVETCSEAFGIADVALRHRARGPCGAGDAGAVLGRGGATFEDRPS